MKKWLLSILILVLLATGFIYYYLPGTLKISDSVLTKCTPDGAFRFLANENNRMKWWPGTVISYQDDSIVERNAFIYKDDTFIVRQQLRDQLDVLVKSKGSSIRGRFMVFPLPQDSSAIEWQSNMDGSMNPVKRIERYQEAKRQKENIHEVLAALHGFVDKPENIYGLMLQERSTTDTLLITTHTDFPGYPSTSDIYQLVESLKKYSADNDAKILGQPMLNVERRGDFDVYVRVALPVNKVLKETKPFFVSRMIPGRFIVGDVTGGQGKVDEAMKQIHLYFEDYRRTSMAIPFQVLLTDRMSEPDTSKWMTRIYAPVY